MDLEHVKAKRFGPFNNLWPIPIIIVGIRFPTISCIRFLYSLSKNLSVQQVAIDYQVFS